MPKDRSNWGFEPEDVINSVPPHWKKGTFQDRGSRWAGQGITTDSRIPEGAPDRYLFLDPTIGGYGSLHDNYNTEL